MVGKNEESETVTERSGSESDKQPAEERCKLDAASEDSPTSDATSPAVPKKKVDKRTHIIREIFDTEQIYLGRLRVFLNIFRAPLTSLLSPAELRDVMGNMEDVVRVSDSLLKELSFEMVRYGDGCVPVGRIFSGLTQSMSDVYGEYCENYEKGIAVVSQKLSKSGGFARLVHDSMDPDTAIGSALGKLRGLSVDSFMILPVQRLPRYVLLMEALLAATPESHSDRHYIAKTLGELSDALWEKNERINRAKGTVEVLELQRQLKFGEVELFKPGREIIYSCNAIKICRRMGHTRRVVLFNDAFLYLSVLSERPLWYSRPNMFQLFGLQVEPCAEDPKAVKVMHTVKSFKLVLESAEVRDELVAKYRETVDNLPAEAAESAREVMLEEGGVAPIWVPNGEAPVCQVCSDRFSLVRRRHHCRNCGRVVCGKCSRFRATLRGVDNQRMCAMCEASWGDCGERRGSGSAS